MSTDSDLILFGMVVMVYQFTEYALCTVTAIGGYRPLKELFFGI